MKGKSVIVIIAAIAILLPYAGCYALYKWYNAKVEAIDNAAMIVVNKADMTLTMYDYEGDTIHSYPMACGLNYGNKLMKGDMRTPEGVFRVCDIQNASEWKHDFGDGNGEIRGAYGSHFIRLAVPDHKGIGIHGTHLPNSIGYRATEGCIRLNNNDLLDLVKDVYVGMVVVITNDTITNTKPIK